MNIIICAPFQNYDHSNGILALIHLGLNLIKCGNVVKFCITGVDDQSQYVIDLLNLREYEYNVHSFEYELLKKIDSVKEKFGIDYLYDYSLNNVNKNIVIYPETIIGNPLKADKVARYFGNKDGVLIDSKVDIGENDFIVAHSRSLFTDAHHYLFFSYVHPAFVVDQIIPFNDRKFSSFYVGKGYLYTSPCAFSDMIEITRHWPAHKSQLSIILQNSQFFFTYDAWSNINVEAVLCGAVPVFLDNGPFSDDEIDGAELGALPRIKCGENIDFSPEKLSQFYEKRAALISRMNQAIQKWESGVGEFSDKLKIHFRVIDSE